MRLGAWLVLGLVATSLAGCISAGGRDGLAGTLGNSVGAAGRSSAPPPGALIGGVAGQSIGRGLDERERQRAEQAEFQALEYGRPGSPIDWRGDREGFRGEVVPGPRYRVNAYDCRDYTHRIWAGGEPQVARGTACRQAEGGWRPIS
ncbi:hypothetical protein OSH10_13580 [Kaistia defluvii]|uniref:hypothetical protein n=1 Tax=Kaistia defluvii TaxID=410841 RepID=UPI002253111A|nr:hypothetical protein [Kaistia defluvii]MCX5519467.1 hypothetical protein [Kaistia defluvii]